MPLQQSRYNAQLTDGDNLEFTTIGNDAALGPSEFSVAVSEIDGATLTLERYSEYRELWHITGDTITTLSENAYKSVVETKYRVKCTGGTASVEVVA